jgi:UDP-N-acetylglucosamine 2-epimerase (non-hydrolysing)
MNDLKVLLIVGARPNFMKVAPQIRAIHRHNASQPNGGPAIAFRLVHTGQHYDTQMSQVFFDQLDIPPPDVNLEVGSGSHALQTANVMTRFEPVCLHEKPHWVVVVGDVNSTLACTLVAAKLGIKVAHVEAGLRSFDRTMPEEINRIVTDALADLLLTPSADANENLRREGVSAARIKLAGNIMIDALAENLPKARTRPTLQTLGLRENNYAFVTLHRPSNVDNKQSLAAIMASLASLSRQLPVVFPMHPRTRKMLSEFGLASATEKDLRILEPVGYHDSLNLTESARMVLTDSGGIQEESTYFRVPCLTLRPNTERPITITLGSNRLTSLERLSADIGEALARGNGVGQVPPFWDGKTADRIVQALVDRS